MTRGLDRVRRLAAVRQPMRRRLPGRLPCALVLALALHGLAAAAGLVGAVGPIGLTVSDLDRVRDFYVRVLGFEAVSETEVAGDPWERLAGVFPARLRVARLRLGDEAIELTEWVTPRGRPVPVDARSNDRWFQHVAIVVSDMDRAYAAVRAARVAQASPEPQRLPDWNAAAGGIRAFYFKDPDGHPLELIWYPPGKGDPRWHRASGRLFRGIDHTAIVVADTEASLRFYRDLLGFRVAGASENYGPEQERLNAVAGARLRITGLRAARGPGVELLEYVTPRDGRPRPADARSNDQIHWQTALVAKEPAALERLVAAGVPLVSRGAVRVPARELGFGEAVLARDPDGHAVALVDAR